MKVKNNIKKVTIGKLKKYGEKEISDELNRRFLSRATDEQLLKAWSFLDKEKTETFLAKLT